MSETKRSSSAVTAPAEHTPGPWSQHPQYKSAVCVVEDGKIRILGHVERFAEGVWLANLRMFVVAPDMLAAGAELAEAAANIHPTAPSSASISRLHAAIDAWDRAAAKARGVSQ